jgi:hypothetical protein
MLVILGETMAQYKSYIEAELVIGIFVIVLFAALAVPGFQIIWWLREGVWHPQTLSLWLLYAGIAPPTTTWVGLQSILDAALDLPVTIYIIG